MRKSYASTGNVLAFVVVVLISSSLEVASSQLQSASDQDQIQALVQSLESHRPPKDLLDPTMSEDLREKQSLPFRDDYQISVAQQSEVKISGAVATEPVKLAFKRTSSTSTEEIESNTHLDFVKRGGRWYFANYKFLERSADEILAFVLAMILAAVWMSGTLLKWRALRRRRASSGQLSGIIADYFTAINPMTWFEKAKSMN
ncbi:MAG TPA: hypothetical protein VGJ21_04235 [Terracidiphilus sp.]|jgi:hypothetical protein